jgi:hypothetical protein
LGPPGHVRSLRRKTRKKVLRHVKLRTIRVRIFDTTLRLKQSPGDHDSAEKLEVARGLARRVSILLKPVPAASPVALEPSEKIADEVGNSVLVVQHLHLWMPLFKIYDKAGSCEVSCPAEVHTFFHIRPTGI